MLLVPNQLPSLKIAELGPSSIVCSLDSLEGSVTELNQALTWLSDLVLSHPKTRLEPAT